MPLAPAVRHAIATLRQGLRGLADIGSLSWSTHGILRSPRKLVGPRAVNVPPEAFPVLDAHADGWHYALWLDDPEKDVPPPIVSVCPSEGTPETIRPVASTAQAFIALVHQAEEAAAEEPDSDDLASGLVAMLFGTRPSPARAHSSHHRGVGLGLAQVSRATRRRSARATLAARAHRVRYKTRDGMGVVAPREPRLRRPRLATVSRNVDTFAKMVDGWLEEGAPGLALAVARDCIADLCPEPGFGDVLARIYCALGRPTLARIASANYGARVTTR